MHFSASIQYYLRIFGINKCLALLYYIKPKSTAYFVHLTIELQWWDVEYSLIENIKAAIAGFVVFQQWRFWLVQQLILCDCFQICLRISI